MLIGFIYGLNKHKISYSENGEDLIVDKFFSKLKIYKGVYVDIGCFHPVWISNTYMFHKMGWSGFAIDVDIDKCSYFKSVRRDKCIVQCGAITPDNDNRLYVDVYKFRQAWSSIDTIYKNIADLYRDNSKISYYVQKVIKVTISEYFAKIGKINLLNIDIEGVDEIVLLNIDLNVVKPEIIIFENNNNNGGSEHVKKHLQKYGYTLLFLSGGSVGYAKQPMS